MKIPGEHDVDSYQKELRSTSAPAALWAKLQEIEKHREVVRAAILQLVDEQVRAEMKRLLNEQERLIVQWHRLYLDSVAGVEALSTTGIAEVLRQDIHK